MFTNEVSINVGSATDHLSATSSILNQSNSKSFSTRQTEGNESYSQRTIDSDLNGFQFDLIKINCKKEHCDEPEQQVKMQKLKHKLFVMTDRLKWLFYVLVLALCLIVIVYSVFRLAELSFGDTGRTGHRIFKRELQDRGNLRWSGIETPSVYEIDPFLFADSTNDTIVTGFNAIKAKLDYLQKSLKVNTILLKNLQMNHETNEIDKLDYFEAQLGSEQELEELISEIHLRSMKVSCSFFFYNLFFIIKMF